MPQIKHFLKKKVKKAVKKFFNISEPYDFKLTKSVQSQEIKFSFHGKEFLIRADCAVPLYEVISEIVEYDSYQLRKVDFSKFDENSVAFDIGGNVGIFSIALSALFPGKIVCCEPFPENVSFIKENLALNHINNVEVVPAAVCKKDEKVNFYVGDMTAGGSLTKQENMRCVEVDGISVKSLLKRFPNVNFVKLDCEGAEYDIVPSLLEERAPISHITAEVHKLHQKWWQMPLYVNTLRKTLEASGYAVQTKPEQFGRFGLSCLLAQK